MDSVGAVITILHTVWQAKSCDPMADSAIPQKCKNLVESSVKRIQVREISVQPLARILRVRLQDL